MFGWRTRLLLAAALPTLALLVIVAVTYLAHGDPALAQGTGICGRTPEVQAKILAALSSIDDCANVTDEDLAGITAEIWVRLSPQDSQEFKSGDFDGLTAITFLNLLSGNQVTELPEGIFDDLDSLEKLYLFLELSDLPDDIFDGLSNLNTLVASSNEISTLPAGVFDGLDELEYLYLDSNQIQVLPNDLFDGLDNLKSLLLTNNEISELPADSFDELDGLEVLVLTGNNLSDLPDGIFEGLSALTTLRIDENPRAPFTFTAELEARGDDVVVKVAQGAPFDMETTLAASGGTLSTSTVTIAAGNTASSAIGVTPNGDEDVVVSVVSVAFPSDDSLTYEGIQTGLGESLTIPGPNAVSSTPAPANNEASGAPTISGTAQVGQTLTADTSEIADADGLENVSYSYQWLSSRDTEITGATSSTYTLQASDTTKTIKVRVTFTDDAGNEESLTSMATGAVVLGGL